MPEEADGGDVANVQTAEAYERSCREWARSLETRAEQHAVPPHTIRGLVDFIVYGLPPGDFLMAVLENNLMESFGRADYENRLNLWNICSFVYNEAPARSHGSPERVKQYMEFVHHERRTRGDLRP